LPDIALELKGVTKRFGDFTAVDNLSLTLERGKILGFLGPNGAGKTTTLRMMLGIYKPDSGRARLLGSSIAKVRERIGYLPEERGLYKRMRAESAIAYIATLKGVKRGEALKRARELLDHFGLGPFARVRIEGLSKGMSQKVQLLAAIAHNPDFAILDEPFSGLDPVNQSDLADFLRALAASGKTILFSTHTMEHAERLSDQLVIMTRGRKVFDGTLSQARALMPRRARIAATGDLNFLAEAPGVTAVIPPKGGSEFWEIDLKEGAEGQPLLAACFERGIALTHFDISPPSLHDVFMALAGKAQP
jgi:ABC-2 type transport system ATP-binding protein